jgi:hypothetical protein
MGAQKRVVRGQGAHQDPRVQAQDPVFWGARPRLVSSLLVARRDGQISSPRGLVVLLDRTSKWSGQDPWGSGNTRAKGPCELPAQVAPGTPGQHHVGPLEMFHVKRSPRAPGRQSLMNSLDPSLGLTCR